MAGSSTRDRRNGTTLEEVASRAGVSRATVSRVVNGSPQVSPDIRRGVEAAIVELGLRPQPGRAEPRHPAQRLDRRRHHRAGRPAVHGPVLPAPAPRHQRVAVRPRPAAGPADARVERRRAPDRRLPDRRPRRRGAPGQPARRRPPARAASRPRASRWSPSGGRRGATAASYVDVDNRRGARSAVDHLIAGGRRTIATIAGPSDMVAGARSACRLPRRPRRGRPGAATRASQAIGGLHPGGRRGGDGAAARRPTRTSTRSSPPPT